MGLGVWISIGRDRCCPVPDLSTLGWDARWSAALHALRPRFAAVTLEAGRVLRQDRGWLRVGLAGGERLARIAGKFQKEAESTLELPTIGDWVALSTAGAREATIHAVLPRRSVLARRMAGTEDEGQVIAANADVAFLMQGLEQPPNPRRIERALSMIAASGAEPVVLLNKSDVSSDPQAALEAVRAVAPQVAVHLLSAAHDADLGAVASYLGPGRTAVLLGPSGVGKSTLANRLLGEQRIATGEVRAGDAKGRHTTTRRELVVLPSGALLIDGPGVREFGLWEADVEQTFPDVDALAAQCRFRDCAHEQEPGCAVRAAAEAGQLDPRRLQSFQRLRDELHRAPNAGGRQARQRKR